MIDHSRLEAAWWASFIGDALAMPVHWYYTRSRIAVDYGEIDHYMAPHNPHPDSILWRSTYQHTDATDDILHDQARFWGGPRGIHYHQFLHAGENTLNIRLAALLAESLVECGHYDRDDFARRYLDFMLTPGMHGDTYVEEYHRAFFRHYAEGRELGDCGIEDIHIGGLATLTPLILFHAANRHAMLEAVASHIDLTHKGPVAAEAAKVFADLMYFLLQGVPIDDAIERAGGAAHTALTWPYRSWVRTRPDEEVVGTQFSPACYLEDSLPATLFLAVKYGSDLRAGLKSNARLGGDNCHRGVVLGALLGAQGGMHAVPQAWIDGLHEHDRLKGLLEKLSALALKGG
ncbi:ADP-ribosylglycohydrolase family protein [Methyloversatilis sp. XJ19-49]|uniref:ADP-ribosylglycohydrolase family protein n=1 Tax=Methyloversatilis sp. XJ19-49 TaxID=2963429 RepID=UPI00211BBB8D|nr:ADP-ribosylglycohydrolase family protein [Methyloversatilis sp. XJ19-49]MCQ9376700.1 ADP-ribosylglycohydrolase family protein [Methyloversatilis sp. XJ19-49]